MRDRELAMFAIAIIVTSAFWLIVLAITNSFDLTAYRLGYAEAKAGIEEHYKNGMNGYDK